MGIKAPALFSRLNVTVAGAVNGHSGVLQSRVVLVTSKASTVSLKAGFDEKNSQKYEGQISVSHNAKAVTFKDSLPCADPIVGEIPSKTCCECVMVGLLFCKNSESSTCMPSQ